MLTAQIICTVALVAWIMRRIDFAPLIAHFTAIRWGAVGLLLGIGLVDRFLTAWKWQILLVAKNIRLGLGEVFRIQMIATFFGSFLPTAVGMDAVRIYLVSKATHRTLDSVSASTVDRLLTVVGTFLIAGATVAATAWRQSHDTTHWIILFLALLLPAALLVAAQPRWMYQLRPVARRVLGHRLAGLCAKLYRSLHEFQSRPDALAASGSVTAGSFIVRILFVQVAAAALTVEVSFGALLLSLPLTWVALMLPISVGGLGLQEGAYLVALTSVGVDPSSAVAISLLEQALMRFVSLLGAVFWLTRGSGIDTPHYSSLC